MDNRVNFLPSQNLSTQKFDINQLVNILADRLTQRLSHRNIEQGEFSPDGQCLILCDEDHALKMQSVTGRSSWKKLGETVEQGKVVFSNHSNEVAWETKNGDIAYRSIKAAAKKGCFKDKWYGGFAFSADNKYLMVPKLEKDKKAQQNQEEWKNKKNNLKNQQEQLSRELKELSQHYKEIEAAFVKAGSGLIALNGAGDSTVALNSHIQSVIGVGPAALALAAIAAVGFVSMATYAVVKNNQIKSVESELNKVTGNLAELNKEKPPMFIHKKIKIQFLLLESGLIDSISDIKIPTQDQISSIAFSGDKNHFFTVEESKIIKKWSIQTREHEKTIKTEEFEGGPISVTKIVPSWSGNWLAATHIEEDEGGSHSAMRCKVWLYSLADKPRIQPCFEMPIVDKFSLTFSPNEKWLAAINAEGRILIFSIESGLSQIMEETGSEPIHTIGWDQENRLLTIGSGDNKEPCMWEVITQEDKQFMLSEYIASQSSQNTSQAFRHVA